MKRKAPEGYATRETLATYTQLASLPSMHSTKPPGVTALDVSSSGALLLTGGADKQVQVYDRAAERTVATLKGHTKRIMRVVFSPAQEGETGAPAYAVSASEDNSLRVWACADVAAETPAYALKHVLKGYKADVTGLDIHPSGALLGSASRDGTWALHDLASGERLLVVDAPTGEADDEAAGGYAYESFAFHPDGQLAATGTAEGVVRVWDILAVQKVSTFRGLAGAASALAFAENGYQLAVGGRASGSVQVWDLRKLAVAATLEGAEGGSVTALRFDATATFLAAVGTDVRVWGNKTWAQLLLHEGNSAELTGVAWDARDASLVVSSLDRTVRTLGAPKAE
jgi:pre-mRNA-processing factor 19